VISETGKINAAMLKLETGKFLGENRRSFDAGGLIVSETEYRRRVFEGWHAHENFHLTLIARGGNCERRKNQELEAAPGRVLFYRRGELHRNLGTQHPSKNINLEIKDEFLERYQAFVPALENSSFSNSADAKFALLKIYRECMSAKNAQTAAIHSLALGLLDSILAEKASSKIAPWAVALREILNDRWDEAISLGELSRLLGVHPVTISKNFPKYFACTLGEYLRKIKIEKAVALIGRQKYALAEIAQICGFADQSHLTRVFRNLTGFTPREFGRF
jgi:AraC family transcriptional regulator